MRRPYCAIVDYRAAEENGIKYSEADLPEAVLGAEELAQPRWKDEVSRPQWALYQLDWPWDDDDEDNKASEDLSIFPASESLEALVMSAKGYPPALALARNDTKFPALGADTSKQDFCNRYEAALRYWLSMQGECGFVLAETAKAQTGYQFPGEWCWILRYYPDKNEVLWVSNDYHTYGDPADCFYLTPEHLKTLDKPIPRNPFSKLA